MTTSAPPLALEPRAPALSDEELIARTRAQRGRRRLSGRGSALLSAVLFVVVAAALAFVPSRRPVELLPALLVTLAYAAACRIEFEFAGGFAVPSQLILVPMWFTLPPRLLPAAVAGALLVGQLPKLVRRQIAPESLLLLLTSSWYAVGPAAVLYFAGADRVPRWSHWYVYVGALAAQFAVNFVAAIPPARAALSLGARAQLRLMAPSFAVDAALAPLGILLAFPAAQHPLSLLLAMPLVALLGFFARERQVRIDHALELSHAYRGTALLLGDVIEADDAYTGSHSRDVVELVLGVADRLGLAPAERRQAEFAALLHDVGKVRIPSEIINKPGALDPEERAIINTHTLEGERMLEKVGGLLGIVGRIVRSCHERWDGGGYPDGLAGDEIPLVARIVCCCDAFNAMTTDRAYRKALPLEEAKAELVRCRGTQFDADVVDALLAVIDAR